MYRDELIINAVDRAIEVMEVLYHNENEMGVSEISSALGVYKSTVFRTLVTLENKGYVYQNKENGKYGLGLRLYALGMVVGERMPVKSIIDPYAKELTDKFNEVFNYTILDLNSKKDYPQIILIYKMEKNQKILKFTPTLGSSTAAYSSASGKALLAFSDKEYLNKFSGRKFPAYTPNTISKWDDLMKELDKIRKDGYAVDNEELEIGLTCVGVPLLGDDGSPIAAISLSGPTSRMQSYDFKEMIHELKETAEKIAAILKPKKY